MKNVPGRYKNGKVVLDVPADLPEGAAVEITIESINGKTVEYCMDGRSWPKTPEGIEAWCRELDEMPPVFDAPAELGKFEQFLAESKAAGKEMERQRWERLDQLFE